MIVLAAGAEVLVVAEAQVVAAVVVQVVAPAVVALKALSAVVAAARRPVNQSVSNGKSSSRCKPHPLGE